MLLAWHNYGGGKELHGGDLQVAEPRRRLVPLRADADPAVRLVQEADREGGRRAGNEVPHRRPLHRHLLRHGRGGERAPRRRDRPRARPRPHRRGGVQQRVVGPRARVPRRLEDLHAPELPPVLGAVRDPLQPRQVPGAPAGPPQHHLVRGPGRVRGHVVEGDRPLLQRLPRDAAEAGGQVLQDARRDPEAPARGLERGDGASARPRTRCSRRCSSRSAQFAQRAARWQNDTNVDFRMAYNHFFGKKQSSTTKG